MMLFRKNMYEVITNPPKYDLEWLVVPGACCAAPFLGLAAFWLARPHKGLMNAFVRHVSTPLKHGFSWLFGHFPMDMAEVLILLFILAALAFLVRTVYLLLYDFDRPKRLIRRGLAVLSAFLIIYGGYCFFWGANYYSDSFSEMSGISSRGCRVEELYDLSVALAEECSALSGEVQRNERNEAEIDVSAALKRSGAVFSAAQSDFDCLSGSVNNARSMVFSRLVSYTGFTGFLFPFTGESLVNTDAPDCLIPSTALHELAHQRNVAGEDECNFVAIVGGLHSGDAEYAYSSALLAYIHVSNALYKADQALWQDARSHLNDLVLADIACNNNYWARFSTPVEKMSNKVYTGFLKSYGQKDGLATYGKCVDLLVVYYFDLHPELLTAGTL